MEEIKEICGWIVLLEKILTSGECEQVISVVYVPIEKGKKGN